MKDAFLYEIVDGPSHGDLVEDRCENLMDQRACWNVSFSWDKYGEHCIAAQIVTRAKPEDKILSPAFMKNLHGIRRIRGKKWWWKNLLRLATQHEVKEFTNDGTTIWRLAGRPHWGSSYKYSGDTVVLIEYDATERHGYALIITNRPYEIVREFTRFIQGFFGIADGDERLLCNKW